MTVRHIFVAPMKGAPVKELRHAEAVPGQGFEGDRYIERHNRNGPGSDATFIELETIHAFTKTTKLAMTPSQPRRNVVTEGVRLNDLVGKRFRVGEAVFDGLELCEPCAVFQRNTHREALKFFVHRGGLRARIVEGGQVKVGDAFEMRGTVEVAGR